MSHVLINSYITISLVNNCSLISIGNADIKQIETSICSYNINIGEMNVTGLSGRI